MFLAGTGGGEGGKGTCLLALPTPISTGHTTLAIVVLLLMHCVCWLQVVFDYPNKRIGWKVPPPGALAQLQHQEQQQDR
jgi:hypothetical protein